MVVVDSLLADCWSLLETLNGLWAGGGDLTPTCGRPPPPPPPRDGAVAAASGDRRRGLAVLGVVRETVRLSGLSSPRPDVGGEVGRPATAAAAGVHSGGATGDSSSSPPPPEVT